VRLQVAATTVETNMDNHKIIARYPRHSAIVFTVVKVDTVTVHHCKMADLSLGMTWWIKFT